MKKLLLMLALAGGACFSMPANAQDINVSMQPTWGPVGYNYVNYYYMPDIETYYNVPMHEFTYFYEGRWITSPYLPPQYANFDLYHSYKVVLNEPNPWYHHDLYRNRYYGYRDRYDQGLIRESSDHRYFEGRHEGGYGELRRGEVRHEEERRGEERRGEERHEEVRHEEERRGEAGRGEERRDDARHEEAAHNEAGRGEATRGGGQAGHGEATRGGAEGGRGAAAAPNHNSPTATPARSGGAPAGGSKGAAPKGAPAKGGGGARPGKK